VRAAGRFGGGLPPIWFSSLDVDVSSATSAPGITDVMQQRDPSAGQSARAAVPGQILLSRQEGQLLVDN